MKILRTVWLLGLFIFNAAADEVAFEYADKQAWVNAIDFDANLVPAIGLGEHEERAYFLHFLQEYNKAWSPGNTAHFDIEVPGRFYQQSDRLFAFDLFPPVQGFEGWQAYSKELVSIVNRSKSFSLVFDTAFFRYARNGNVAWMSATFRAKGVTQEGHAYESPARQTVVLELIGDRWLVAHEHISTPYVPQ